MLYFLRMKRVLVFAIVLVIIVGGIVYLLVRTGSPASPGTPDAPEAAVEEVFDVDAEEIAAQETLDGESADGTDADAALDDDTISGDESAFGTIDVDALLP